MSFVLRNDDVKGEVEALSVGELSQDEVYYGLTELDPSFRQRMEAHLDLAVYAQKLYTHAHFIVLRNRVNQIVGVIAYYTNYADSQIYIPYVCVDVRYRRKGIADRLFDKLFEVVHNYRMIKLEVNPSNEKAVELYKKHGFLFSGNHGEKSFMTCLLHVTDEE